MFGNLTLLPERSSPDKKNLHSLIEPEVTSQVNATILQLIGADDKVGPTIDE